MQKSLKERVKLLERRLASLEAKKTPEAKIIPAEISRGDRMLIDVGFAHVAFHMSDTLRRNPKFDGYDDMLRKLFDKEMTPETRFECSKELWDRGMSSLDEAKSRFTNKKP